MSVSTLVIFGFALGAALLVLVRTRRHRQLEAWRDVADDTGLEYNDHGWWRGAELSGTYRGAEIAVSTEWREDSDRTARSTVYRAELPDGFPDDVTVEPVASKVEELRSCTGDVRIEGGTLEVVESGRTVDRAELRFALDGVAELLQAPQETSPNASADGGREE